LLAGIRKAVAATSKAAVNFVALERIQEDKTKMLDENAKPTQFSSQEIVLLELWGQMTIDQRKRFVIRVLGNPDTPEQARSSLRAVLHSLNETH
jgi:hypothetical protein